jgi:DNA primase
MSNEEIANLIKAVKIVTILPWLGIDSHQFTRHKGQLRGRCPIHRGDSPQGLVINPRQDIWYCFAGCGGGNIIHFVAKIRGVSPRQAADMIAARFLPQRR